jgi:hypothetical protein
VLHPTHLSVSTSGDPAGCAQPPGMGKKRLDDGWNGAHHNGVYEEELRAPSYGGAEEGVRWLCSSPPRSRRALCSMSLHELYCVLHIHITSSNSSIPPVAWGAWASPGCCGVLRIVGLLALEA